MKLLRLSFLFSLLLFTASAFGHGVERGSVWESIFTSSSLHLTESAKSAIIEEVESRCELTGLVSATAEEMENDSGSAPLMSRSFSVRLRLVMEGQELPVIILVNATELATPGPIALSFSLSSPVCR